VKSLKEQGITEFMWWEEHASNFPHLYRIAKRVHRYAVTSADAERVFSTAGYICNKYRSTLSPFHLDILIFLMKNLPVLKKYGLYS